MRLIFSLVLALGVTLVSGRAMAKVSETGTFISMTGTVTIKSQAGHHAHLAKVGDTVKQGQRVVTDKDSTAAKPQSASPVQLPAYALRPGLLVDLACNVLDGPGVHSQFGDKRLPG